MEALERYLNSFGKSVVNKSKGILNKKNKVASGELLNSINYRLVHTNKGIDVVFSMVDYGKYIDKGVSGIGGEIKSGKGKGNYSGIRRFTDYLGKNKNTPFKYTNKRPPTKALDKWIVRRGIAPRDSKGRFMTRKSLKYAISYSIYIKGIEGVSFFQKPLGLELKGFSLSVAQALTEDLLNNIRNK